MNNKDDGKTLVIWLVVIEVFVLMVIFRLSEKGEIYEEKRIHITRNDSSSYDRSGFISTYNP